ncbi:hypothetical protein DFH11DRAFT_1685729 [Phellopilus nigrolimitatus]|nr:hypothetical protein DFH11DRAFT_1685729 [Phellopilus nigrolimitatus]
MDQNDLETYQVQLSQVDLALSADPDNTELKDLASELKELIELTRAALAQTQAAATKPRRAAAAAAARGRPAKAWVAGDECLAKYSGDGNWYPARITSVGGAVDNRVFSIVFRGYNTTELSKAGEIKALPASYAAAGAGPYGGGGAGAGGAGKRKLSKEEEEERERKKRKNGKKVETRAAKAEEQNKKQASWQKFAKKSEKKGIHIAGVSGTSIFKTPENPLGKVGVTGSGKGMTENAPRPKNKFARDGSAS